jgi:hypothetical protein
VEWKDDTGRDEIKINERRKSGKRERERWENIKSSYNIS